MTAPDFEFVALQAAVAGRFSLERQIGRGGMGIVFLARDVLLDRHVAIKLLAPALGGGGDVRRRFLREARIAAQCFHPHIVPIHGVEETDALAWIVMPYVRGETLAERVQRLGPLPGDEVRRLAREVGWGLAYAHQRGVVHRDIKPENILIEAGSGRFLIADFGIARGGDGDPSTSGGHAGTPRYMAPEQAVGESVDGRADLYALGATLYFAASGRPPFDANSSIALIAAHATILAPPVRTLAPALPAALADVIDRCLAKRPDDRYPTADKLVEALTPAVGETTTSPLLVSLTKDAQSARSLLGWAATAEATTLLLALGERGPSLLGHTFILYIGTWFSGFIALGGAVRVAETLRNARRLLRDGHDRDDVTEALVGEVAAAPLPPGARGKRILAAVVGAALALSQSRLVNLVSLPTLLDTALQTALTFGPALLIGRGISGVMTGSAWSRALHDRVNRPLTRLLGRITGQGIPEPRRLLSPTDNAATEVLLDRAIHDVIAQLPTPLRAAIGNAAELASSLAREAEELRLEDARVLEQLRAARHAAEGVTRDAELERLDRARGEVRERLATTIAALEAVRLDILRLYADQPLTPGLTTNLEAVRELGRRIDAGDEVNALLAQARRTNATPA